MLQEEMSNKAKWFSKTLTFPKELNFGLTGLDSEAGLTNILDFFVLVTSEKTEHELRHMTALDLPSANFNFFFYCFG